MRIVLDACVPQPLRHNFEEHEVFTARFLRLHELDDAELLDAIEAGYDALVTCDRSIPWQNQFAGRGIALIILRARTNKLADLEMLVPDVLRALRDIKPGEIREVAAPD